MINSLSVSLSTAFLLGPIFLFMIYFLPEKHNKILIWMPVGASLTIFLALILILPGSLDGLIFETTALKFIPDIDLFFRIDLFGLYFALISSIIWIIASIYSMGYMKNEHSLRRYYFFFTICLYFIQGIAFAGNLFTLFIFYEFVTLSGYPLIIHEETEQARNAAKKYLYYTLIGDAFVLFSIFMAYRTVGSLNFDRIHSMSISNFNDYYFLIACTIIGFGVKAALMPLHAWVADAHPAAPSPASALLSGVLVNVGIFGMARMFYNIFGSILLPWARFTEFVIPIALFTIIAASVIAINQDNLKRRLAYSTIGQLSYIILGLLLVNKNGLAGGLVHIANHAFMKSTLFLCAGAIIKETGIKNISDMKGLAKRMPITMTIFSIAALGMIGTPPFCGFVSKWILGTGILEVEQPLYLVVLLISSLLAAIYFLPIIHTAFFQKSDNAEWEKNDYKFGKECSSYMLYPMVLDAILVIIFGIFVMFPGSPLDIAIRIANKWIP
ncbi:hypothetical protein HZA55_03555 [Candidatus Poribacteria bacterium]|nr:hypothetical protein [Candidatus Poribacteria bacterium]